MSDSSGHIVAIIGGAVAGSEATLRFAEKGIKVVVFEQNPRPYGKIEDGLPKWHAKQRGDEYVKIDERLDRDGVYFVPSTKLGEDVGFNELVKDWGFSAVLLANGAWKDNPVPIDGADDYVGKGLIYQNPLVYWFNHFHEADYSGPRYEIPDGTAILGGGLASIDVAKICMLVTTSNKLKEMGHDVDVVELEHGGIPKTLDELGVKWEDLGLEGCTLLYRRRPLDMPLAEIPRGTPPEKEEKFQGVRQKVLDNAMRKYLFKFRGNRAPSGLIVENGRLVGLKLVHTRIENHKVIKVEGTEEEWRAPLILSSIGSIPEPIQDVPMNRNWYTVKDEKSGQFDGMSNVYGLGNAVTGKGNIRVSRNHGGSVADQVADQLLAQPAPGTEAKVMEKVEARWKELGYTGYRAWVDAHTPKGEKAKVEA
jgi:NADPH-dependent glutamate synthase beta subunit-like oxidoreductase